jgi:hypothetical protein
MVLAQERRDAILRALPASGAAAVAGLADGPGIRLVDPRPPSRRAMETAS